MKKLIALPVLFAVLLTACEHKEAVVEKSKTFVLSDTMRHMITIDTVRNCPFESELSLSGVVAYNDNNVVKVFPRSSGQVIESRVSLGDKVVKGQALAVVRSADIAGNYNDLKSANADISIAKRQLDNAEQLFKNGISSEREYNEAKENYQKALAARNKIESLISINGGANSNAGGQYTITAPIDGYIVEKKVSAGAFIRSDATDNLFTISNLKNVWIYANVYEADIAKVKEGDAVQVMALSYPDKIFKGKIDKVSQVLDPQSKALKVRITLDNSDMLLKPDMFAKVVIANEGGGIGLCIPTSSLIPQESRNYVIVYNNDSDLKIAAVKVIKTVNERTYISNDLNPGDRIITQNQILIYNQLIAQ
jgi:cobalt-zinc-cadmium efflux system membrane fusion protein